MKYFGVWTIEMYQLLIKPVVKASGVQCYFKPSCSEYTKQAIIKYGVFQGVGKGFWRILRCNPYNKNIGYDPA